MMRALVNLCVRHFGGLTALTILALVLGGWQAMRSPLDVFPEFVPSQVDIQTEAPGFAPQQVEELVTRQVEFAVNGAAGIATMPSGVGTPKLSPLVSSTMDLLKIGLISDKVDPYTLRDAANWVIKPRLLGV